MSTRNPFRAIIQHICRLECTTRYKAAHNASDTMLKRVTLLPPNEEHELFTSSQRLLNRRDSQCGLTQITTSLLEYKVHYFTRLNLLCCATIFLIVELEQDRLIHSM